MRLLVKIEEELFGLEREVKQIQQEKEMKSELKFKKWLSEIPERTDIVKINLFLSSVIEILLKKQLHIVKAYDSLTKELYSDEYIGICKRKKEICETIKKSINQKCNLSKENYYFIFNRNVKRESEKIRDLFQQQHYMYITENTEGEIFELYKKLLLYGYDYYFKEITEEELFERVMPIYEVLLLSPYVRDMYGNKTYLRIKYIDKVRLLNNKKLMLRTKGWYQDNKMKFVYQENLYRRQIERLLYVLTKEQIEMVKEKELIKLENEYEMLNGLGQTKEKRYSELEKLKKEVERVQSWQELEGNAD